MPLEQRVRIKDLVIQLGNAFCYRLGFLSLASYRFSCLIPVSSAYIIAGSRRRALLVAYIPFPVSSTTRYGVSDFNPNFPRCWRFSVHRFCPIFWSAIPSRRVHRTFFGLWPKSDRMSEPWLIPSFVNHKDLERVPRGSHSWCLHRIFCLRP